MQLAFHFILIIINYTICIVIKVVAEIYQKESIEHFAIITVHVLLHFYRCPVFLCFHSSISDVFKSLWLRV